MSMLEYIKNIFHARASKPQDSMLDNSAFHAGSSMRPAMLSFRPSERPVDSEMVGSIELMRARSRDIIRNSSIGSGIIKLMNRGVIGDGLKLMPAMDAKVIGLSSDEVKQLEEIVEQEFALWADSSFCDTEQSNNFYNLQNLVFSSYLENGDVFVLLTNIPNHSHNHSLSLNVIESDMCKTPRHMLSTPGVVFGVRKNKYNAPVSYFFRSNMPRSEMDAYSFFANNFTEEYREVPVHNKLFHKQVLHIFESVRPGQTRGVPFLTPVLEEILQIERYATSELHASVISSKYTIFIKNESGMSMAPNNIEGISDHVNSSDIALGDGSIVELGQGQDISIANPGRPNPQFADFIEFEVNKIAMGLGIPHEVLMQKFSSSYSASRGSLLEAEKAFAKYRKFFIDAFCKPVYERFFDDLVASGRIKAPGYDDPIKRKAYLGAYWIAPKKSQIDEVKEVNAAIMRIEAGLSNKTVETMQLTGMKFERVLEIRKKEIELEKTINNEVKDNE